MKPSSLLFFLINRLPSKVLDNQSPIERLYGHAPDYTFLRTFGCAVWPNLRPYNSRKLEFRSKQCVFIGYSNSHKGFKCLDPKEGRVYISRDVVFDENVFPFASLHKNAGARLRAELHLLPEILRNPSMQFGDAIVLDQQPGSPGNTNEASSTVDVQVSSEKILSSGASNGGQQDRFFMCRVPGAALIPVLIHRRRLTATRHTRIRSRGSNNSSRQLQRQALSSLLIRSDRLWLNQPGLHPTLRCRLLLLLHVLLPGHNMGSLDPNSIPTVR